MLVPVTLRFPVDNKRLRHLLEPHKLEKSFKFYTIDFFGKKH